MAISPSPHHAPTTAGFSLVELSVVLVIIAVIAGSALTATLTQTNAAKKIQTDAKMEAIEQAIAAYITINGRIPCPAPANAALNNASFGTESCAGTAQITVSPVPASFTQTGTADTLVIGGALPVKSLQLPNEFAFDGWGNRFTYIITRAFATTMLTTSTGLIKVSDAAASLRTDQAAYALISHGQNGHGAWLKNGNRQQPASSDAAENENALTIASFNETIIQKEATPSFDDITHYAMKWQLIRQAGAVISNNNCIIANDVINQAIGCGRNTAADCPVYLLSLANQVNQWCLRQ